MSNVKPPIDLEVLGTDITRSSDVYTRPCVAMIVCHGMGQQVPFETLDAVAKAITNEHLAGNGVAGSDRSVDIVLRFVRPTGSEKLLPRAEVTLKNGEQPDKIVHLYEAYWAPVTEGVISYTQTAWQLVKAGLIGLRDSWNRKFSRWMFGRKIDLPVDRGTGRLLVVLLVVLIPLLALPLTTAKYLKSIVDGHGVINPHVVVPALLLVASYFIRKFIIQYMGDVIIYVSSNEVNSFSKARDEIKQIGLSLAKVVYGAVGYGQTEGCSGLAPGTTEERTSHFLYSKIVVVGHSLGSVVAYDTLNAIINQDELDKGVRGVVERTEALITFGSPLDKTAFLFRQKAKTAVTRDMLATAFQPMILDYKNRPRWWINIFCQKDIISGSLEYYDDPRIANTEPRRVRNFRDPCRLSSPVSAHTGYWERDPTKAFLYRAATDSMDEIDRDSFRHSDKGVEIRTLL